MQNSAKTTASSQDLEPGLRRNVLVVVTAHWWAGGGSWLLLLLCSELVVAELDSWMVASGGGNWSWICFAPNLCT